MKPFDWNKRFTYKGKPARLICSDRKSHSPYVILVTDSEDREFIGYCKPDGTVSYTGGRLENVVENTSAFYAIYGKNASPWIGAKYDTRDDITVVPNMIGVLERQYEDGEYKGAIFHGVNNG